MFHGLYSPGDQLLNIVWFILPSRHVTLELDQHPVSCHDVLAQTTREMTLNP